MTEAVTRVTGGTGPADRLIEPDYTPPLAQAIPLGLQHVLAMFVANFAPASIVGVAAGYAAGSPDMVYLIQMAMLFAGVATLFQTVGFGPVGGRLPIMQGTSFTFLPVMIPLVKEAGMGALFGGVVAAGSFHVLLGSVIGRIRHWLPPLVTGLVVLTIGLSLIPVGVQYAAGGGALKGTTAYGAFGDWGLALLVIMVALGFKFFARGFLSAAAVLAGLVIGYLTAIIIGKVDFAGVASADWFALPRLLSYGFELHSAALLGMCLMAVVSTIETVGDVSGITKGGANREATAREISGATYADGLGSAIAGLFGGLPNTSFSQNVGLVAMTGVMSRHVVTIGALFLILCGLVPKVGAVISAMPIAVLGGGVVVMFGMVAAAGLSILADVEMTSRNMVIIAIALSVGLGLNAEPEALQHLDETLRILLTSGILPVAFIAVFLNALLPDERKD